MNTITATIVDHEPVEFNLDGVIIPIVVGFNRDGTLQTARDLAARPHIDPATCDHAGASWFSNLAMHCPKCGSPMFLPPRLLAYHSAETIAVMAELWSAAGWPEWHGESWCVNEHWTLQTSPLFDHCGGIPVREDRLELFSDAAILLIVDHQWNPNDPASRL